MTVIINEGIAEVAIPCDGKVHKTENIQESTPSKKTKMEVKSDKKTGTFQLQLVGAKP